ncbi:ABC transporter ATP-binding protein [Conexibacter sp. SYSU D00693]|uniref:ABC transporter ATP-binding protein n=1 Tax=Conexibacter sp. SYSU D00693 TaxID=2812560 RepID=UPI001F120AA5|nr:ABC transporter ATP-binding protein [Conexibacter sp. SYSU D00693]
MATRVQAPTGGPRDSEEGVALDGVARSFGATQALAGLSLHAAPREVVAVVGPSGSGKSTLLELVCGLQEPDAGTVRAARAVLMPQRDLLLPWMDALDNAALPLRLQGAKRDAARAQAHPVMAELGLAGFERARPHELSGGMRQRVAVARTLLSGAPVLCLDEPFGALDAITRADAQAWLAGVLAREPRTVLLVTHDVEEAAVLADRIVVLSARPGRVVAELPVPGARPRHPTGQDVVAVRALALDALRGGGA